jgi:tRNA dimethylallyltransferase
LQQHTPKAVIVIAGATATGKTDLALRIASQFNTAIISADSRQCYREMTIGTAKPSEKALQQIPHYFINSHSITEPVHAALFEKLSLAYAGDIFRNHDVAVLCGGTGLYIQAFCAGLDEIPAVPASIRQAVQALYDQQGLQGLQARLHAIDPDFLTAGESRNPRRLMRALEVKEFSGQSILSFRKHQPAIRDFAIIKIGLELPKPILHERIAVRTEEMIRAGLVEEVRRLAPYQHLNALQTVGYREIFDHLAGRFPLSEAIRQISLHTRQYAKRQLTWFKKDKKITWFTATDRVAISQFLRNHPALSSIIGRHRSSGEQTFPDLQTSQLF